MSWKPFDLPCWTMLNNIFQGITIFRDKKNWSHQPFLKESTINSLIGNFYSISRRTKFEIILLKSRETMLTFLCRLFFTMHSDQERDVFWMSTTL